MSLLLLRLACASAVVAVSTATGTPPPNFLVLFVDDMGMNQIDAGNPSVYGYTGDEHRIATPHIAQLAKEGMLFQHWYSSFHYCSPSRGSMLTGRLPVRLGIGIQPCDYARSAYPNTRMCNGVFTASAVGGLAASEITTGDVLRGIGYATGIVGKVSVAAGVPLRSPVLPWFLLRRWCWVLLVLLVRLLLRLRLRLVLSFADASCARRTRSGTWGSGNSTCHCSAASMSISEFRSLKTWGLAFGKVGGRAKRRSPLCLLHCRCCPTTPSSSNQLTCPLSWPNTPSLPLDSSAATPKRRSHGISTSPSTTCTRPTPALRNSVGPRSEGRLVMPCKKLIGP